MDKEGGESNRQQLTEAVNLFSNQYGDLTVISKQPIIRSGRKYWLCRCRCDRTEYISERSLLAGKRTSCMSCVHRNTQHRAPRMNNLAGQRFGRLLAIEPSKERSANGNMKWLCKCDCGNYVIVDVQALKTGTTKSCGCLRQALNRIKFAHNPAMLAHRGNPESLKNSDNVYISSLKRSVRNRSGVVGVSYDNQSGYWIARLRYQGRYVLNTMCRTKQEAIELRQKAELKYLHRQQSE